MGIGGGFLVHQKFRDGKAQVHLTVNAYGKESRELGSWTVLMRENAT